MSLPATIHRRPKLDADPGVLMLEKHFTLAELAEKWSLSYEFVLEHFRDEPGVLRTKQPGSRKRTRCTIRIPESVAVRVYSRMVVGA